ncbi:MAG: glycosyltransferase [Deltaproteobacteria bacterium]|nr:glycosyltransferase [Deltaproteobacteria bacterium]MBP2683942.1 glycosyltransferase [Deltaproteobacteria bacterium]MBS1243641.1 glycosyltransferase [Deltaproteobacteria bacterium]
MTISAARPARLLYLIVDLPVGGAEIQLLNLVRHLDRDRYSPVVLCIGKNGPIGEEIAKEGVPVTELGLLRKGGGDRRIVTLLREFLRREKISLVHSHLYHANYFGRLAAFRERIPAVCTIHNTYAHPKIHRRLINRWLARKTARIIAVSGPVREDIIRYDGVDPSKVVVIPNGVDPGRFDIPLTRVEARERLGIPAEHFLIGTVGRLEEQKGLRYLVDAVRMLRERGKNAFLLVAGSGREEVRLREQATRGGIEDAVFFLGARRDVPDLYRAMDVFALSSLWEGGPITLLEAMASGLPVVATPVGFVPEVVRDGVNGFLVPARDPAMLGEALWRVREDPVRAAEIGREGRETVRDRYTHRHLAEKVMAVYEEVLPGFSPQGEQ